MQCIIVFFVVWISLIFQIANAWAQTRLKPFLVDSEPPIEVAIGSVEFRITEDKYAPRERLKVIPCGTETSRQINFRKEPHVQYNLDDQERLDVLDALDDEPESNAVAEKTRFIVNDLYFLKGRGPSENLVLEDGNWYVHEPAGNIEPLKCFHQAVYQESQFIRKTYNIGIIKKNFIGFGANEQILDDIIITSYEIEPRISIEAYPTIQCDLKCQPEDYQEISLQGESIRSLTERNEMPPEWQATSNSIVAHVGNKSKSYYLPVYMRKGLDVEDMVPKLKAQNIDPWIEVFIDD